MIYFLDSSALIKRYISESGSAAVRRIFARKQTVAVSRLAHAELAATFARLSREGRLTEARSTELFSALRLDIREFDVTVEVRGPLLARVESLVLRQPLRAYDAVQLASALQINEKAAVDFWSADVRLVEAAKTERMRATLVG